MTNTYSVIHNQPANRFEVALPGGPAILIYSIRSGLFLLMHTEVPVLFEGRGIAAAMSKTALEYAKENSYKVRSYCAYITRYIDRHPEYKELLG